MPKLSDGLAFIKKHELLFLFLFILLVYNLNFRAIGSSDTIPASLLPFSILENHNLYLDQFSGYYSDPANWNSTHGFIVNVNGHWLSSYPIVTPVLATPLYILPDLAMHVAHISADMDSPAFKAIRFLMEKIGGSAITALSCVFIYLALRELLNRKTALAGTLIYAFATDAWAISAQGLWQHGTLQLLLAAMLYLIFRNEKQGDWKNLAWLGILSGLFIFNRPSDSPLLLPVLVYVLFCRRKDIIPYTLAAVAAALPFLAYNLYYFGSVSGGYTGLLSFYHFDLSMVSHFLGQLISPNRGLFIFTPVALLAIPGFFKISSIKNKNIRTVLYASAVSAFLILFAYSAYGIWWGGGCYGPRFLTCLLPIIAILIGLFIDRYVNMKSIEGRDRLIVAIIAILVIVSVLIQIIGTFFYPTGLWAHEDGNEPGGENVMWDWHQSMIYGYVQGGLYNPFNDYLRPFEKLRGSTG